MTVEDFITKATECGYDFDCNRLTQGDIDICEGWLNARLGRTPCTCKSSCCCEDNCALVFVVWAKTKLAPQDDVQTWEQRSIDYLVSKGCYSYGNW